jgi:hypothetical protein
MALLAQNQTVVYIGLGLVPVGGLFWLDLPARSGGRLTRGMPAPDPQRGLDKTGIVPHAQGRGARPMFSRSSYALGWFPLLLWHPPTFYVDAMAVLGVLLGLVVLGHAVLGLMRDWRRFREGR